MHGSRTLSNIARRFVRYQSVKASSRLPNAAEPPMFTLATIRAFPSLEPMSFVPVPTSVLGAPLRRDLLWRAVVYENDNKRVGSSNPPGRSENGFSRRKVLPQKGSGRARAGDANSPTRNNGARALARNAPNDYTTELPRKVYSLAFNNALSYQYKRGNLFVIGGDDSMSTVNDLDFTKLDISPTAESTGDVIFEKFMQEYGLGKKKLLFVINEPREGLFEFTEKFKDTVNIVQKEFVDVNDLLKAHRVLIELDALEYLAVTHSLR
ncbi:mitochondrial 54S ribosomal protein uL4m Ecym_4101 [Eremothecium cymbalariae DBVPG|uniref:Large ribosomal subunit protein uL4m n=1 Tax=Eremothecium cymbalariae (strain CBS 270.75 / DBVPG 7215 / KCTC 17166 / NRRL Y-17582) TaxID=931890 RepID=G8JT27_ERECY|nr:hypothetical protein Ecym_4101 [Eremothecium cymbalariae DBVPG\